MDQTRLNNVRWQVNRLISDALSCQSHIRSKLQSLSAKVVGECPPEIRYISDAQFRDGRLMVRFVGERTWVNWKYIELVADERSPTPTAHFTQNVASAVEAENLND